MSAILIMSGFVMSSCSSNPEGIPISSPTLNAYRTPSGSGILCGGPGEYDFLTFAITKGVVSGHIVETAVSTRAELPMNGYYSGHTVTLQALSGFGGFNGTLDGQSLTFSSVSGVSPPAPIQCTLVSLAKWREIASHTAHFTSRQLSTPEFLAMDDLIFATAWAGPSPWATPVSTLIERLSAAQSQMVHVQAPSSYPAADVAPEPRLSFSTGAVRPLNDVSVTVSTNGYVLTVATRAADGSCWYDVSSEAGRMYLSTAPGIVEASCSAVNLLPKLVRYDGP
jgi:hypothetical protein